MSHDERLERAMTLEAGRPRASLTFAVAIVTMLAISIGSLGALLVARHFRSAALASGARVASPAPSPTESPNASGPDVQVVAPTTNVVWTLVDHAHLYRSTDQGNRWEQRPSQVGRKISFVDDQMGWLLSPGSAATQCEEQRTDVWHTTDAGATWQKLAARGVAPGQCKDGIWFVDAKDGFLSAGDPNHQPTIYRTSDGGNTWTASTLPDPPDFKTLPGGFTLDAVWVKRFGFRIYLEAAGTQGAGTPYPDVPDRRYLFTSTDSGATWKWMQKVPPLPVVMVTETRWLALSAPGQSSETVNGGQQFHQFATDFNPDSSAGTQFVFADSLLGYASGKGLLQRTADGGSHWVRISSPGGPAPSPSPTPAQSPIPMPTTAQVSAPSANVVWALVAGVYLFRSTDMGKTWEQKTTPPYNNPAGVDALIAFADANDGWVLARYAAQADCLYQEVHLWRTTDGAATWQLVSFAQYSGASPGSLPIEQCKESMYFADARHGFVGASDPTRQIVYRTSDGGVTWSAAQFSFPPGFTSGAGRLDIVSIKSFGSDVRAYAPPYVYGSPDGGVTWGLLAQTSTVAYDLAFVSASRWIVLAPPDESTETTDAGKTSHLFATDYSQAAPIAPQVVFADSTVGYATVRGSIQQTLDGGTHWGMIKNSWP
ncbi:MAG TPA: hypothetical protein VGT01_04115 [Candidatus Dormibacteraeota bacterium]|nr:hypothetical protein [Candidatus Dormibacteraeota bacterium]